MATSLSDLLLRTYRLLEDMPILSSITANILATPTSGAISVSVNDPTFFPVDSRMEIDDELFLVTVNNGVNPLTAQRAYESSVAAAHTSGALVRRDPRFLRATVKEAIDVVVGNWCSFYFPKLVWDTTSAGSFTPIRWIYKAPADALAVRRVVWQLPGFQRFVDVDHSQLQEFPTAVVDTGLGFEVYDQGLPGRTVQVQYDKRWPVLALDADVLDNDFPAEADDLIPAGAVLYVAGFRQTPKWRMDEIIYHREANQTIPANFNVTFYRQRVQEWYLRAVQVRARRPTYASPGTVYIGAIGR